MNQADLFFSDRNTIQEVPADAASQLGNYLAMVQALARMTYMSIYVIDYQTKGFEYVSENPLFLCGLTAAEVQAMGYDFYIRNVQPDDLGLLLKINEAGFNFYETLAVEERKKYLISYDFHLINEDGKPVLINHQLTPVFLNEEGKIWKALCVTSLASTASAGNATISKQGSDEVWKYDQTHHLWRKEKKVKLSKRQIEILRLHACGLNITEIAEKLFISIDTVKFHRRKLFEKTGMSNITEALAYAAHNKLI